MRYFIILILFYSNVCTQNFDERFFKANNYYNSSKYLESINVYESILVDGWESYNLYYNLGNAYFRQNMIGHAIWAYNKALKIDPRNSDVTNNLEIVNARIKDRIILPDEFFLVKSYMNFKSRYTLKEWLFIGGITIFFAVIIFLLSRLFFFNKVMLDRIILSLIILAVIEHGIILDRFFDENDNKLGIIIDNEVDAYSGPFYGDNTILFKVNEGTKVSINQDQNNWVEIILLDGNRGWISLEKIRQL